MRIDDVRVLERTAPWGASVYLELTTDDGRVGVSEAVLTPGTAVLPAYLRELTTRQVVGFDPFETEALVGRLARVDADRDRLDELTATAASLVEVACWDVVGKALGVPVYRLLGGAVRDRIRAYASGWAAPGLDGEGLAAAAQRVAGLGYGALALDPFGGLGRHEPSRAEIHRAARRCETVRAAVGPDVEILIELRGRFDPSVAARVARALERVEPSWISDPVAGGRAPALEQVRPTLRARLAVGGSRFHRYDYVELLLHRSCDVIQPELARSCGFLETRKIAAMAEACSIAVAPRLTGGAVARAACLHLAATLNGFLMLESRLDLNAEPGSAPPGDPASGCPPVVLGSFPLPHGPGLGITLHDDRLPSCPPA